MALNSSPEGRNLPGSQGKLKKKWHDLEISVGRFAHIQDTTKQGYEKDIYFSISVESTAMEMTHHG